MLNQLEIETNGENFIDITQKVQKKLSTMIDQAYCGTLTLFNPHTSCSLCLSEAYDPSAKIDLENFLKHLAPQSLKFIQHTTEGADDSPSHMKSILLQNSMVLIVDQGHLVLGQWQGIYLCEFRQNPKIRKLYLKAST